MPPKGAPPPGWRPTVKGKSGDSIATAAVGGNLAMPSAGSAPVRGGGYTGGYAGAQAGRPGSDKSAEPPAPDLSHLLGGDISNYGMWAEAGRSGVVGSGAGRSRAAAAPAADEKWERTRQALSGGSRPAASEASRPAAPAAKKADTSRWEDFLGGLEKEESSTAGRKQAPAAELGAALLEAEEEEEAAAEKSGGFSWKRTAELTKAVASAPPPEPVAAPGRHAEPPAAAHQPANQLLKSEGAAYDWEKFRPDMDGGMMKRKMKLILDLESHIVDQATEWAKMGFIEAFVIRGRTAGSVEAWSDHVLNGGGVMTPAHFEGNGIEMDLAGFPCAALGFGELEKIVLAVKKDTSITKLNLARSQLSDTGTNMLAGALLRNRTLTALDLSDCGIGDDGAEALAAAVEQSPVLAELELSDNLIGARGASQLAESVCRSRKLEKLNLAGNSLGDEGAERMASLLDPAKGQGRYALRKLELGGNRLGQRALSKLTALFEKPGCPIRYMDFGDGRPLMKGEEPDPPGDPFEVIFARTGVEIRRVARKSKPGDVTWRQDANDVEITFAEAFFRAKQREALTVVVLPRKVQIKVKSETLFDADLWAPVKKDESTWISADGCLQVTLRKQEPREWPALFKQAGL